MLKPLHEGASIQGSPDSGRYFKYMAQFVDFSEQDVQFIRRTKPIIEKHLPEIIDKFYAHLLRYPPTRKFFIKKDGSIDQEYLEMRMRHQANFWLRTADAIFDDEYATYLDYVGRAHTSRGADPRIYIAERYVIGQVGFMAHAITMALTTELRHVDEDFELCAIEAWNKLLMIVLELLARAYGHEREAEDFDPILPEDKALETEVNRLSEEAYHLEHDKGMVVPRKRMPVAQVDEIPEGERKVVTIEGMSIGIFHHNGQFYALRNKCLHRGGPVATGTLDGNTLTCPWHGFQYNVMTGQLLADPNACLDTFPVENEEGRLHILLPDLSAVSPAAPIAAAPAPAAMASVPTDAPLKENEFRASQVEPGQTKVVQLGQEAVVVYNVGGTFFATVNECTHRGAALDDGDLDGPVITCAMHGSRFDVATGQVKRGPATKPLVTHRVVVENGIGRVEKKD
ncbi:MAG: Rieske 2Fe-2S domain-containing protein [Anaerolineae bacterium]